MVSVGHVARVVEEEGIVGDGRDGRAVHGAFANVAAAVAMSSWWSQV